LTLLRHAGSSSTSFSTVRFGNVLGSNGSVVPRLLDQIRAGGPVTITHPQIERYFMLIPEAVQLVLHASARPSRSSVYVLDMGEPIKLVDLARHLIRLSGSVPDDEIAIEFIGLRPGEKLFEELVGPHEVVRSPTVDKILEVEAQALPGADLDAGIAELERLAVAGNTAAVIAQIRALVPEFSPPLDHATPSVASSLTHPYESQAVSPLDARSDTRCCPACGSGPVARSRTRSLADRVRRTLTDDRPHRCAVCGWRGWIMPMVEIADWNTSRADPSVPDFRAIDRVVRPIGALAVGGSAVTDAR
jgi:hypothetical protein